MRTKKPNRTTKGPVLKEDVLAIIQAYIRNIQMNDYGKDAGIPQLYHVMSMIEEMPLTEQADVSTLYGEWLEEPFQTLIPVEFDADGKPILRNDFHYKCSLCGRIAGYEEPYCHCGAKMNGGIK